LAIFGNNGQHGPFSKSLVVKAFALIIFWVKSDPRRLHISGGDEHVSSPSVVSWQVASESEAAVGLWFLPF
jgi:hypothetical protein